MNDLIIVQDKGVYYIYLNALFYCSCDSIAEVREELQTICENLTQTQNSF